jgi:signal transduction histidine kinase
LAEQILHDLDDDVRERQARIDVEAPLGTVMAHRDTLELVLSNLVANALKFVPRDRVPQIRVAARPAGPMVRIAVRDNGIGVSPDDRQRIFKPFERLHSRDVYAGSGLGLALVARGIDRMGGKYGVESNGSGGSEFWIELPAARMGAASVSTNPDR